MGRSHGQASNRNRKPPPLSLVNSVSASVGAAKDPPLKAFDWLRSGANLEGGQVLPHLFKLTA